ncbi:hypothetical protein HOC80_05590 [archaeon]|jgi:hypothetical protein|nr:hypothetical protein [archaeon]MBT4417546.1 hypothetical protein [archaeon]
MNPVEEHVLKRVNLFNRRKGLDQKDPLAYFDALLEISVLERELDQQFSSDKGWGYGWVNSRRLMNDPLLIQNKGIRSFVLDSNVPKVVNESKTLNLDEADFLLANYDVVHEILENSLFPTQEIRFLRFISDLRTYLESGLEDHPWFYGIAENYSDLFSEKFDSSDPRELYNYLVRKIAQTGIGVKDVDFFSNVLQINMLARPLRSGESVSLGDLIERPEFDLIDPSVREVLTYDLSGQDCVGEPLERVLFDVSKTFVRKVVIKKPKKAIPLNEFGSWIYDHPEKRLRRDREFAEYLGFLLKNGVLRGFESVKPVAFDRGLYVQEVLNGTRLIDLPTHEKKVEAIKILAQRLAQFHKRVTDNIVFFPRKLAKANYMRELRAIGKLCGWKNMRGVVRAYKPFLSDLKPNVVCHNSLHHKNVFVVYERDSMVFPLLDFELVAYARQQDDLVRLIEGPIQFKEEEKMQIFAAYYLTYSAGAFHPVEPIPEITDKEYDYEKLFDIDPGFVDFYSVYNLRRCVLHRWAHNYLSGKGVPNADLQIEKSFQALGEMRRVSKDDKRVISLERALLRVA